MTHLNTDHPSPIRGMDIFSASLASQEAAKLANRLSTIYGIADATCQKVSRYAETVLIRAIHENPRSLQEDIGQLSILASKSIISGSRRNQVTGDMQASMTKSAKAVHQSRTPAVVSDPFNDAIELSREQSESFPQGTR